MKCRDWSHLSALVCYCLYPVPNGGDNSPGLFLIWKAKPLWTNGMQMLSCLSDTSVLWYMLPCTAHQEVALFDLLSTVRTVGDDSHHTPHLPTMACTLLDAAHSCGQSSSDYHTREPLEDFATDQSVLVEPGKCMMHPMTASTVTLLHSKREQFTHHNDVCNGCDLLMIGEDNAW